MIVDGDERSRLALRQGLRSQPGLEVASEATNGETGLVLLDSIGVDVVVVTAPLPYMAIADFIQRVQAQNPCQPLKLMVLTDNPTGLKALGAAHCPRQSPMTTLAEWKTVWCLRAAAWGEAIAFSRWQRSWPIW